MPIYCKRPVRWAGPAVLVGIWFIAVSGSRLWAGPREDFLRLIDRPRVPSAADVTRLAVADGLEQFHFTFAAEAGQRVPGILVMSKSRAGSSAQPRPAVICLHGTGGS